MDRRIEKPKKYFEFQKSSEFPEPSDRLTTSVMTTIEITTNTWEIQFGSYEHMLPPLKNIFQNVKKSKKKSSMHLDIICEYTNFHEKRHFLWPVLKRQKTCHKKSFCSTQICLFNTINT